MPARPTVYLFDIDGTLLDGKGAGRAAMEGAFRAVVGTEAALGTFSFAGMTDRAIVRTGLGRAGLEASDARIDELLARYLSLLPEAIDRANGYGAHRGVEGVLDALEGLARCAIGLGTGNVEAGARIKLRPIGLEHRFAFGGFGCDHEARAELLRIGAARGAAKLGVAVEHCRVVVIGDTPKDIEAARTIGAECLAVATSIYGAQELRAHRPELVVSTLEHDEAMRFLCALR